MAATDHPPEVDPRVAFAAERTLLAWIRTGLAMMGFGFVVARFGLFMRELFAMRGDSVPHTLGLSRWAGTTLVVLGVVVNLAAAAQHWHRMRLLEQGQPVASSPISLATGIAGALAALGMLMAGYLISAP